MLNHAQSINQDTKQYTLKRYTYNTQ